MALTTDSPMLFPSIPWFEELARRTEHGPEAERFHRLGVTDTTCALRIGERAYRLVFDGYGCNEVTEWDGNPPVDFVIEASLADWLELIEHLHQHGGADGSHSLNSLVLTGDRFRLSGDEQLGIDCFYRYNATIQAFVELAAGVPTVYHQTD